MLFHLSPKAMKQATLEQLTDIASVACTFSTVSFSEIR